MTNTWRAWSQPRHQRSGGYRSVNAHLRTERHWVNPVEWLAARGISVPWIVYDPERADQYVVYRSSTHDGTWAFVDELFDRTLLPLLRREACCASSPARDANEASRAVYYVGNMRWAICSGRYTLPCGLYPAQRESLTLPVRVVYGEDYAHGPVLYRKPPPPPPPTPVIEWRSNSVVT